MSASELSQWLDKQKQSSIELRENTIRVYTPEQTDDLTLLFRTNGNYTIESPVPVYVKNVAEQEIELCIQDVCEEVEANQFFTQKTTNVAVLQ
jgi:hypothetical protein